MYIKRHLEAQILAASKYYPVVMVCGQRQIAVLMQKPLRDSETLRSAKRRTFTRFFNRFSAAVCQS